jgi:D-glycero-D-manno-heptose 1,7-bisphosphate phosphatase
MVKCIFWDRDGIINDLVEHDGKLTAPWHVSEFKFKPHIKKSIQKSKSMGFLNFVVTNQPDVFDGWLLESHLNLMNRMIIQWLHIDEVHNAMERNTPYYKPNSQMVLDLIKQYNIKSEQSYIIGDTWKDIVCGHKAELNTIFVGDKYVCPDMRYIHIKPNNIVSSVTEAIALIEEIELYD